MRPVKIGEEFMRLTRYEHSIRSDQQLGLPQPPLHRRHPLAGEAIQLPAYRSTWRYGQRGYRYMHLDAGHVCQNLYLAAGAIGCGCCAIGAFDDDAMAEAVMIDPAEEFVIYLTTVGLMNSDRP